MIELLHVLYYYLLYAKTQYMVVCSFNSFYIISILFSIFSLLLNIVSTNINLYMYHTPNIL